MGDRWVPGKVTVFEGSFDESARGSGGGLSAGPASKSESRCVISGRAVTTTRILISAIESFGAEQH